MRLVLTIIPIVFATAAAHAQFGIGLQPATQCLGGFQPAQNAIAGRDQASNIQGRYEAARQNLERINTEIENLDERIGRARNDMGRVLSGTAVGKIEEHRRFNRGYYDYYDCPRNPGAVASASGSVAVALPHRGAGANPGGSISTSSTPTYPPEEFCYRGSGQKPFNAWAEVVDDRGRVGENVCDQTIPFSSARPSSDRVRDCREGLRDLYQYLDRKSKLETMRAKLDAEARDLERRASRLEEQISEGTYCAYCESGRRGYSTGGLANSLFSMNGLLVNVGINLAGQQPQFGRPPAALGFPGPSAFPGNPYPAATPGYPFVNNGVYGGLPGGIGQGGFSGCGGPQGGFGPQFGGAFAPVSAAALTGGQSPFMNPFADPLLNPSLTSPLFASGFGPGFGPQIGAGLNSQFLSPNALGQIGPGGFTQNPFQQLQINPATGLPYYGQNPFFPGQAAGALPNGSPYFQQPYQFTQNPYYQPGAFPYGAPAALPYGSPFANPYGANTYGNPALSNYPNNGVPLGNFYYQMEQMKQSISGIAGSPLYGGSAPMVLPYPSTYAPSPIYNVPGTTLNPLPAPTPAPPPVPTPAPNPGTPNVIRTR